MSNAVMLDLETMSTAPNAAIISIGAVTFDTNACTIGPDKFYRRIDLRTCKGAMDPDTILWWMGQEEAARKEFTDNAASQVPEVRALRDFIAWLNCCPLAKNYTLWANGANFDPVILRSALKAHHIDSGFVPYYRDRCYRTAMKLLPEVPEPVMPEFVAHNALHDATYQTMKLVEALGTQRAAYEDRP